MRAGYLFAVDKRVLSRYLGPLASYPRNVHNFPEKPAYRGRVRLSISPRITHFLRLPTPRTHDYAGKTVRLTTAPSPIPDEFLPPLLGVKISRRILLANSSGSSECRGSPFAGHPILPRFRTADGPRKFATVSPRFLYGRRALPPAIHADRWKGQALRGSPPPGEDSNLYAATVTRGGFRVPPPGLHRRERIETARYHTSSRYRV